MSVRDQQKRQTRHAFFQATLALCAEGQAFSSISLRQISRTVGVVPTAFYRHFKDMDDLGNSLVQEELGTALAELRSVLQVGKKRTHDRQIAMSIVLFFRAIDKHPAYWHFIVTERYGGSASVHNAMTEQIQLFTQILGNDLGLQPAFGYLMADERVLLADMGVNLFFSWVYDWLNFGKVTASNSLGDTPLEIQKNQYLARCTRQAQLLFYGVSHWKPESLPLVD